MTKKEVYYKMRSFHGRFLNVLMIEAKPEEKEWKIKDG